MKSHEKNIGYWKVSDLSLYYAFTLIDGNLFGCKVFSIVLEDWVKVNYKEEIRMIKIDAVKHTLPVPSSGNILYRQACKRSLLPEGGIHQTESEVLVANKRKRDEATEENLLKVNVSGKKRERLSLDSEVEQESDGDNKRGDCDDSGGDGESGDCCDVLGT
jgi:hypothetical protein